jgi:hypothetical protein
MAIAEFNVKGFGNKNLWDTLSAHRFHRHACVFEKEQEL